MGVFSDHTDEDLAAAIVDLTAKITGVATAPQVFRVIGEGRRIDYNNASFKDLRQLLREAKEERDLRAGGLGGSAIGVRF